MKHFIHYTLVIPCLQPKDKLKELFRYFIKKKKRRYVEHILGRDESYLVKYFFELNINDLKLAISRCLISKLTTYILVTLSGHVFQKTIGIPIGTNYALLHVDLFVYSHETDFILAVLRKTKTLLTLELFNIFPL